MAGGGCLAFEVDADDVKGQAGFFIQGFRDDLQSKAEQLRDQATLGGFHLAPALVVLGDG
ncbi:hypothetical protein D3C76_1857380 [compost metagenome]